MWSIKRYMLVLCCMMATGAFQRTYAQVLSGRTMLGFYTWGRELPVEGNQNYYTLYEGGRFQIKGKDRRNVSFHVSYRVLRNFGDYTGVGQGSRLYNAYLNITNIKNRIDLSLGRQYVFAGVGYGAMDGARITTRVGTLFDIITYAGILTPSHEQFEFAEWNEGHMFGVQLKTVRLLDSDISVSYINKERSPDAYTTPGQFSNVTVRDRSQETHLVGLDFRKDFTPRWMLSTRLESDLAAQQFDRAELYTRFRPADNFFLTGEYYFRKPRIRHNSIFSVFRQYDNQEIWLKSTLQLTDAISVHAGVSEILYQDETATRLNAGLTGSMFTLNLFKTMGYAGSIDGGTGGFQIPIRPQLTALGGIYLSRYKLYEDADDFENLASSYWGLNWQPTLNWEIDAEAQAVHNKLFSRDMRFFLRISRQLRLGA